MTFLINSDIHMDEVYAAHRGHRAFLKGKEEGEGWGSASLVEQLCEMAIVGSKAPHLIPFSFCKGRGNKRPCVGICGARFHEK